MDEGLLYKHQGKGTFIISPEKRSPEQFCTTRLLVVIPDYEGNTARLSFYDKKLISGISDYTFHNSGKLELRPYGDSAESIPQFEI